MRHRPVAQLTGGVAHDFNNLLTAIVGCLDLIALEGAGERISGLADAALRAAARGTRLTQQLLAFSRRQALRPVVADLNVLLAEVAELLQRTVGEAVEIIIDGSEGPAYCELDPAQFEAAVMNLILNARDAMPGSGRVRLTTRRLATAELPTGIELAAGDYIAFSVRDDGEGVTPDVAAHAFEPFYTTKEIGKGSGLGLSMVYGFAKQSGGGVRLDTAPGAGVCVTLYLPRSEPRSDAAEPAASRDRPQHRSAAVLVVEDDADVGAVSVAMLQRLGYRVALACDGQDALALLRGPQHFDLLFSDLVMPHGMSGLALAHRARALRPGLKVLLTTGYAGAETLPAREFPILPKPFRPAELGEAIAELLAGDPPD
ncbi:MAG TPA: ATP-binding protein [Stellaceae bacterium]|nr:ATP-binding protein [Stellaceae bacterium]